LPRAGQAFRVGLAVVLTNPKAMLMWVAVTMVVAAARPGAGTLTAVALAASMSALAIHGGYALLFSTGLAARAWARLARAMEATVGALFVALGLRLFRSAR